MRPNRDRSRQQQQKKQKKAGPTAGGAAAMASEKDEFYCSSWQLATSGIWPAHQRGRSVSIKLHDGSGFNKSNAQNPNS